jgi:hypothetical protein
MQRPAEFQHQIAHALLPQAAPIFHHAATLDTTVDRLNPQPTLAERLVCPLLRPR